MHLHNMMNNIVTILFINNKRLFVLIFAPASHDVIYVDRFYRLVENHISLGQLQLY